LLGQDGTVVFNAQPGFAKTVFSGKNMIT